MCLNFSVTYVGVPYIAPAFGLPKGPVDQKPKQKLMRFPHGLTHSIRSTGKELLRRLVSWRSCSYRYALVCRQRFI